MYFVRKGLEAWGIEWNKSVSNILGIVREMKSPRSAGRLSGNLKWVRR